jgi:SPP1 family predicted phage head-tail adaptor
MANLTLDRRITILQRASGVNAFNEPVDTWNTLTTVWSSVVPVLDGERLRAGETLAQKSNRFTIRHTSVVDGLNPRDRVVYDGKTFDINGIKELGRNQFLEITATARAESGT